MGLFVALVVVLLCVFVIWHVVRERSSYHSGTIAAGWRLPQIPEDTPEEQLAEVAARFGWPPSAHLKDRLTGRIGGVQVSLLLPDKSADPPRDHWQLCFDSEGLSRFELLGLPPLNMRLAPEQLKEKTDRDVIWTLLNDQARELLIKLARPSQRLCFVGPLVLIDYERHGQDPEHWIERIQWGLKLEQHLCDSLHLGKVPKGLLTNVQQDKRQHVQKRSLELLLQHYPEAEESRWAIRTALARTLPGHNDHEQLLALILNAFAEAFSEEWCPPEVSLAALKSSEPSLQLLGALASQKRGAPLLKQFALNEKLETKLRIRAIEGLARRYESKVAQPTLLALAGSENLEIRRQALQQLLSLRAQPRCKKWPSFEILHQEATKLLQHVPTHALLEITDWLRQYAMMDDEVYEHDPPLLDNTLYLLFRAANPEQVVLMCDVFAGIEDSAAEPLLLAWLQYEKVKWLSKDQEYRTKQAIIDALSQCGTIESIEPIRTCIANGILPISLHPQAKEATAMIQDRAAAAAAETFQIIPNHGKNTPDPWYQSTSKQSMPGFDSFHDKL